MTFVRFTGCNLRCTFCDTTYAFAEGQEMSAGEIIHAIKGIPNRWVCFTGGEPLLQNPLELAEIVKEIFPQHIALVETNGTIKPAKELCDLVSVWSVSPKLSNSGMVGQINVEALACLVQHRRYYFKFVVNSDEDVAEALDTLQALEAKFHVEIKSPVVFQPLATKEQTVDEYLANLRSLWQCIHRASTTYKYELRVLPQLHRLLFGQKRGI